MDGDMLAAKDGFYLHVSSYQGAFLAFVSGEPVLDDELNAVLDAEVVESRNMAHSWFAQALKERPWEGVSDGKTSDTLRNESSG